MKTITLRSQLVTLKLTESELALIEKHTGLQGEEAFEAFTIALAEEFVWPDEETVKTYLARLAAKGKNP